MKKNLLWLGLVILLACEGPTYNKALPILGNHVYTENDTLYHRIRPFQLINQDSVFITRDSLEDHIYVSDFFFTSCPTICPKMKAQMLRVYEQFENDPEVLIVSHTIDPQHDTVAVLNTFAKNLGVSSEKWHFLTGEKDSIYALAESSYLVMADEDPNAPGGYIHSGAFLLVDKDQRVRGAYDGTMPDQVDLLMKDIELLKKEYE
jgi:protein SCO1/2